MYMNIRIRKENKIILAQTESLLHFISVLWKKSIFNKTDKRME